jgi:hypothetical protein
MSLLTERLFEVLARSYPGCPVPRSAAFWPMYSLDSGDLSTTAAVELAKLTKQSAEVVAARLIAELADVDRIQWRSDNGYIVCSNVPIPLVMSEVQDTVRDALNVVIAGPDQHKQSLSIWCLVPDCSEPTYARLRIVARCALHALLAVTYQGPLRLCFDPLSARHVHSMQDVVTYFRQGIEWVLEHEGEVRREVLLPLDGVGYSVWTTHHYHERISENCRSELAHLRRAGTVQLSMPADGWLRSRDRALSEILAPKALRRVIDQVRAAKLNGEDKWLRLLFHLASTVPSGDFDPAVALFDECASPLWSMRELVSRFRRLSPLVPSAHSGAELAQSIREVESYRKLVLSGLFLPVYTARAIVHNEIGAWCGTFERLAREGHSFINAPATRRCLNENGGDDDCLQIAAGLGFGLSCIVPVVTEERCADQ